MKNEEKEKAIKLRKEGKSYREILSEVSVARGTLSEWLHKLILTEEQIQKIKNTKDLAYEKRSKSHKEAFVKKHKKIFDTYNPPYENPIFMLGLGIYMGEGYRYSRRVTGISNSDPIIILIFMDWIKKFFFEDGFSFGIKIQNHDRNKNVEDIIWWGDKLNIPCNNFLKTVSKISKISLKKRNTLEHGTCHMMVKGHGVWVVSEKINKAIECLNYIQGGTDPFL